MFSFLQRGRDQEPNAQGIIEAINRQSGSPTDPIRLINGSTNPENPILVMMPELRKTKPSGAYEHKGEVFICFPHKKSGLVVSAIFSPSKQTQTTHALTKVGLLTTEAYTKLREKYAPITIDPKLAGLSLPAFLEQLQDTHQARPGEAPKYAKSRLRLSDTLLMAATESSKSQQRQQQPDEETKQQLPRENRVSLVDFIAQIKRDVEFVNLPGNLNALSLLRLPNTEELNPLLVRFPELEHTLPTEMLIEKNIFSNRMSLNILFQVAEGDTEIAIVVTLDNFNIVTTGLRRVFTTGFGLPQFLLRFKEPLELSEVRTYPQGEYASRVRRGEFGGKITGALTNALNFTFPTFLSIENAVPTPDYISRTGIFVNADPYANPKDPSAAIVRYSRGNFIQTHYNQIFIHEIEKILKPASVTQKMALRVKAAFIKKITEPKYQK